MTDQITLIESAKFNNGERTVIKTVLAPYSTILKHYHTLFSKKFEVVEGEIDIWNGFGKFHLEKGQASSIDKNTGYHYVIGKMETTLIITLKPGNIDFENALHIMKSLNIFQYNFPFNSIDAENIAFFKIMSELTDCNYVDETLDQINNFLRSKDGNDFSELKQQWLNDFCN